MNGYSNCAQRLTSEIPALRGSEGTRVSSGAALVIQYIPGQPGLQETKQDKQQNNDKTGKERKYIRFCHKETFQVFLLEQPEGEANLRPHLTAAISKLLKQSFSKSLFYN